MTLHPVPSDQALADAKALGHSDFIAGDDASPFDEYTQPFLARAWHDGYAEANASDDAWAERERIRLANDPDSDYSPDDFDEDDLV